MVPYSFSCNIKNDTCGAFVFNHRILMLILMGYTHDLHQFQSKLFFIDQIPIQIKVQIQFQTQRQIQTQILFQI